MLLGCFWDVSPVAEILGRLKVSLGRGGEREGKNVDRKCLRMHQDSWDDISDDLAADASHPEGEGGGWPWVGVDMPPLPNCLRPQ